MARIDPGISRRDCCHKIFFWACSAEKEIRHRGPSLVIRYPRTLTYSAGILAIRLPEYRNERPYIGVDTQVLIVASRNARLVFVDGIPQSLGSLTSKEAIMGLQVVVLEGPRIINAVMGKRFSFGLGHHDLASCRQFRHQPPGFVTSWLVEHMLLDCVQNGWMGLLWPSQQALCQIIISQQSDIPQAPQARMNCQSGEAHSHLVRPPPSW